MQPQYFAPYAPSSHARALGCFSCTSFQGRFLAEHVVCDHLCGIQMIGQRVQMSAKWFVIAALVLLCNKAHAEAYACTTNDGHIIAGREPPPECKDRDIQVLSPDGSVKEVIPAPLTPEQRKKRAVEEEDLMRKKEEERNRAQKQMPWPPLEKDSTIKDIEAARRRDLAPHQVRIDQANQRINQLRQERKRLDEEVEFYGKHELPSRLKEALETNKALVQEQEGTRANEQSEMLHVNEHFNALKQRYYQEELQKMLPPVVPNPPPDLGPNRTT